MIIHATVFVVHDFDNDGRMDIYPNRDTGFVPIPSKWRKRGVNSRSLLISYKQKDIVIRNFSGIVN